MVILIPQLSIEARYSEYWPQLWQSKLQELGVECTIPYNVLPVKLDRTKPYNYFTNTLEALDYELSSLKMLLRYMVSREDKTILFLDGDFPGLSTPFVQVLKMVDSEVKCYSYVHAGSWCNGDIFAKVKGKREMEYSMLKTFDKVFVATNYHKDKIEEYFSQGKINRRSFTNLKVVGFPFYEKHFWCNTDTSFVPFEDKEGIFVIGRPEQSKGKLVDRIKKKFPGEKIYSGYICDKKEYYSLLSKLKVVLSLKEEETFGLGMVEAISLGCLPLCPRKFSYTEVVRKKECLYTDDLIEKLGHLLEREEPIHFNLEKWEKTIPQIVKEMKL